MSSAAVADLRGLGLRRGPDEADREPDVQELPGNVPVTLSSRLAPFLLECDQAIEQAAELRDENAQLHNELRYLYRITTEQGEKLDKLARELGVALRERDLLRARMKVFGEAANTIVAEVSKEAEAEIAAPPVPASIRARPGSPDEGVSLAMHQLSALLPGYAKRG